MTRLILFSIESVDPAEVESEEKRLARLNAYDAWQRDFMRRFYAERAASIRASGDPVRIRLLVAYEQRERAA